MHIRKNMINANPNCKGCNGCRYYPYFHYIGVRQDTTEKIYPIGDDIEFIKFSENHSIVINHTTGLTHIYDGKKWILENK